MRWTLVQRHSEAVHRRRPTRAVWLSSTMKRPMIRLSRDLSLESFSGLSIPLTRSRVRVVTPLPSLTRVRVGDTPHGRNFIRARDVVTLSPKFIRDRVGATYRPRSNFRARDGDTRRRKSIAMARDGATRRRKSNSKDRDGDTRHLRDNCKARDVDTRLPRPFKVKFRGTHPDTTHDLWHRNTPLTPGQVEVREAPPGEVASREDATEA